MTKIFQRVLAGLLMAAGTTTAVVASPPRPVMLAYADLADLADGAPIVAQMQVRKMVLLKDKAAKPQPGGVARVYIEGRLLQLLAGNPIQGENWRYIVELRLDAAGKLPRLKNATVVVFARMVAGRPGELQLVAPDAQLVWDPVIEARVRSVLDELNAPGAPGRIAGIREIIHVSGNLAGQGETQIFLSRADEGPAAIVVDRAPESPTRWHVTFSEVLDAGAGAPARDTLAWYRLACFLPERVPGAAHVSGAPAEREQAEQDYRFVLRELGDCGRLRGRS